MGGVIPTSVYYVGALAGAGLGRLSAKAVRCVKAKAKL